MNIIAIDCGASFIKGAIFVNGKIAKKIHKYTPAIPVEGKILCPVWVQKFADIVKDMILELAEGETEVKLCIANEMHGFVLCYQDGTPFTDYISWQREYGRLQFGNMSAYQILSQEKYKKDIVNTGMPLRSGLPSCNLLYLVRSGIFGKAKGKLFFYSLGDYLLRVLSGKEPVCHPTNAAASGLYNLKSRSWNQNLVIAAGAENIVFPFIGNTIIMFELNTICVHALPAIGDQQAALLGAGLRSEDELSFNLGTGAQVSKLVQAPLYGESYQIRPYFGQKYIKTIPHLPSGRALNVYFRFFQDILKRFQVRFTEDEIWDCMIEAEKECKSTDIQCDLSFFENPITDHVVGSITNIQEYALDAGSLLQSIFLQMGKNFIWAADRIETQPARIHHIIFSGGVAKKIERVRREILANYPERIKVSIASDETLSGLYQYGNKTLTGNSYFDKKPKIK